MAELLERPKRDKRPGHPLNKKAWDLGCMAKTELHTGFKSLDKMCPYKGLRRCIFFDAAGVALRQETNDKTW
jgi:hypothetical protein